MTMTMCHNNNNVWRRQWQDGRQWWPRQCTCIIWALGKFFFIYIYFWTNTNSKSTIDRHHWQHRTTTMHNHNYKTHDNDDAQQQQQRAMLTTMTHDVVVMAHQWQHTTTTMICHVNSKAQWRGTMMGHNDSDGAWARDTDASQALGEFFIMILLTNEYSVLLLLQMEMQKWQAREATAGGYTGLETWHNTSRAEVWHYLI